jgi:phosphohistidine swiveling domain-containing protein
MTDVADVLLLRAEDLRRYAERGDAAGLSRIYQLRAREYRRHRRLEAPVRLGAGSDDATLRPPAAPPAAAESGTGDVLTGVGFGRGSATGRARLVRAMSPALLDSLDGEDVLVLLDENAFAYADWHSLLMSAKGVVSVARPAHHLTQVAREIGVPVVGYVRPGVESIREDARVHLDAERGTVRLK